MTIKLEEGQCALILNEDGTIDVRLKSRENDRGATFNEQLLTAISILLAEGDEHFVDYCFNKLDEMIKLFQNRESSEDSNYKAC